MLACPYIGGVTNYMVAQPSNIWAVGVLASRAKVTGFDCSPIEGWISDDQLVFVYPRRQRVISFVKELINVSHCLSRNVIKRCLLQDPASQTKPNSYGPPLRYSTPLRRNRNVNRNYVVIHYGQVGITS